MWIDLSSDKKARAVRLNWHGRLILKRWGYDEDNQAYVNRLLSVEPKWLAGMYTMGRKRSKGRWKTRGGRDQDRWRKRHKIVKIMRERRNLRYRNIEDYCRANGIEFRRFAPFDFCDTSGAWPVAKVTVDGVDECGVAVQMADELQCDCDSFNGTLTLTENPDCDFVKGGESDVMPK